MRHGPNQISRAGHTTSATSNQYVSLFRFGFPFAISPATELCMIAQYCLYTYKGYLSTLLERIACVHKNTQTDVEMKQIHDLEIRATRSNRREQGLVAKV